MVYVLIMKELGTIINCSSIEIDCQTVFCIEQLRENDYGCAV